MRTFVVGTTKIDVVAQISREALSSIGSCSAGLRDRRPSRMRRFESLSIATVARRLPNTRWRRIRSFWANECRHACKSKYTLIALSELVRQWLRPRLPQVATVVPAVTLDPLPYRSIGGLLCSDSR
jgi:hypothetical protein